jgi:hypothetical protein
LSHAIARPDRIHEVPVACLAAKVLSDIEQSRYCHSDRL